MAGNNHAVAVSAQLGRLLQRDVLHNEPLQLRSIHRAVFCAWARQESIPISLDDLASGAPFTIEGLLSGVQPVAEAQPATSTAPLQAVDPFQIGIDIEDVSSLPEADDYRSHSFFQENFSRAEISHCIQQVNVRASFCGVWAAKEAVVKAGLRQGGLTLRHIEISYDAAGKPQHGGCKLSISHTPTSAVAVCLAQGGVAVAPRAESLAARETAPVPMPTKRWPWSRARA